MVSLLLVVITLRIATAGAPGTCGRYLLAPGNDVISVWQALNVQVAAGMCPRLIFGGHAEPWPHQGQVRQGLSVGLQDQSASQPCRPFETLHTRCWGQPGPHLLPDPQILCWVPDPGPQRTHQAVSWLRGRWGVEGHLIKGLHFRPEGKKIFTTAPSIVSFLFILGGLGQCLSSD